MAIEFKDKTNVDAPDAVWLYGKSKNNTGSNNGTPVNHDVMTDYFQFFARMAAQAGITFSGLPDNDTNGWQYFEALKTVTRENLAVASISANAVMSTYITAYTEYAISQIAFEFTGQSAAITFGLDDSANLLDGTVATLSNAGNYSVTVSRGGSDTINGAATSFVLLPGAQAVLVLDRGNVNWIFKKGHADPVTISAFGSGYTATQTCKYRRSSDGMITLEGSVNKTGGFTGAMFNLPVGFRPTSSAKSFPILITDGSTVVIDAVTVNTNGNVNWQNYQYAFSTTVDIMLGTICFYPD